MENKQIQTIKISGITCGACVKLITRKLNRMEGVNEVISVSDTGEAKVAVDVRFTKDAYIQALAGTPYEIVSVT